MELKDYQQRVIDNLAEYLLEFENTSHLGNAFKNYWHNKGVTGIEDYKNNVFGVPHVCAKVPTAGGKTFIAVNAIKTIFDAFAIHHPKRSKLVIWLVPSLTILEQTVKNLSDSEHPYRQRLNQLFSNRVVVYEKRDVLMGAGFSADSVLEQLSIVVMSFDSLRAKNKEDRKIFQDNGYLASFLTDTDEAVLLPDYDPSALINVIRRLKPIVIVDESHNAETALSVDMLKNLNPHFIFDLTATPRNNSNIISYVDAMQLKKKHMVKLPVIVANRTNRNEAIEGALLLRQQLEAIALDEQVKGGKYIRPIVLLQAEARTGEDKTTFEKTKAKLVELGIPIEQIKIKTADMNELKGVDLMSIDCPVRYIITVNALKEGWDCPFAYILVSLADKSSAIDVEQILGRILRMPHVQQHGHDLLNLSYVFTASNLFLNALQSVVNALNKAGFSEKDFRDLTLELELKLEPTVRPSSCETLDIFTPNADEVIIPASDAADVLNVKEHGITAIYYPKITSSSENFVNELTQQATAQNKDYEAQAQLAVNTDIPATLENKMNKHKLKVLFREQALTLTLPQFFTKVDDGGWIETVQLFERDYLLKEFKLSQADSAINFEDVETEMYRVDLEDMGDENYKATPLKVNAEAREKFNTLILKGDKTSQIMNVTARLVQLIGNMYPIDDGEVKKYIGRIVESFSEDQIRDCLERDVSYVRKIKQKITALANIHAYKTFNDFLDIGTIFLQPSFNFAELITSPGNAPALPKSLYATEAAMGQFEARVINDIANLKNVVWWHRNLSRGKGFRLNGFLNHCKRLTKPHSN
jgi:type III restriction enzyme